jgi:predicted small lipoprotein YifL
MIVLLAASLLAGCGKKGKLEPPEDGTTYPRTYPSR